MILHGLIDVGLTALQLLRNSIQIPIVEIKGILDVLRMDRFAISVPITVPTRHTISI
jgi:hypothetical protein